MKITFLVSGNIRSNFSYRALSLARSLRKEGHEISVIAPKADKYNNFVSEDIKEIDGVIIKQPFQFSTKRLEINLLPYLFGVFWLLVFDNSEYIYIYKPTPITVIGLCAKLFRKAKIIVDIDDLGSEVMKLEGQPVLRRKLVEWSEKLALAHTDALVVASTYLYDLYHTQFPNTPIQLMANAVSEDWFEPTVDSKAPKRIVFMGSIDRKGILEPLFSVLPKVIATYPDTEVTIIGDGDSLSYFKKMAMDLHMDSHILFTGWLQIEKARAYLQKGDIGYNYMPDEVTIRAASNMKVPQYMARGVVPLVSEVGDLPRTVGFGSGGYVCKPDDDEAFEATLREALKDTDRIKKADMARSLASENLSWDAAARTFESWISK